MPQLSELINSGNVSFISKDQNKDTYDANGNKIFSLYGGARRTSEYIMPLSHFKGKNVWILKPTSLNRGKGIHVVGTLKKIKKLMRDYCREQKKEGTLN
mmetsp:Transcript_30089/g.29340  ORF Transcript_30089/g.29340 Transcript_30089/m.29340 type:complete len:99 (+) Transcript_30089:1135-1431(+)